MWDGAGYTARLHGFRLLVMHHRGRGRSSRVEDLAGHARGEYADDVVAVADAAGVERFAFAGYSMGAAIGYRLAAAHPHRVSTLVAIGGAADPPGEPDDPAPLVAMLETEGMPALSVGIEAEEGIALPAWLRRNFDETDAGQFALSLQAWAARRRHHLGRAGPHRVPDGARRRIRGGAARLARADGSGDPERGHDRAAAGARARRRVPRLGGGAPRRAPRSRRESRRRPSVDFPR